MKHWLLITIIVSTKEEWGQNKEEKHFGRRANRPLAWFVVTKMHYACEKLWL
jgi:hypothetical protein